MGKQVFIIQKELNQNWILYSNKFQSVEKTETAALDSVSGFKVALKSISICTSFNWNFKHTSLFVLKLSEVVTMGGIHCMLSDSCKWIYFY